MYKRQDFQQFTIEGFNMPFGGMLRADNRWVKLEAMMPWEFIEAIYAESMSMDAGAPAICARIAFGAQFIKESENLTDERTVEYIAENPYMQYFLGLRKYRDTPLFDPSMMVHFRRRFPAEKVEEINKRIFAARKERDSDGDDAPPSNNGKLVLDATCAPADIRYPSDLSLLNEARENTEDIIEELWDHNARKGRRTRYNRRKARAHYLAVAKQKKPSHERTRQAIGKQLGYVRSNLDRIGELLLQTGLQVLPEKRILRLLTVCELYRQQSGMYRERILSCRERIVSLRQPHVRPMVRGKAGSRYEFGQKLALSVVSGYTFIERQSFDNFNEGISLIESVERYKRLYGSYPEAVQADRLYRNKDNLAYCKRRGIRLSGPKLGRPGKDVQGDRELERQDHLERNIIEGRSGTAKRRFGLDLIMAVLPETAMTEAAFQVLCMNARIRLLLSRFFRFLLSAMRGYKALPILQ
jgi:hypothetical protein